MERRWIYYGIFFNEDTISLIRDYAERLVGIPEDWDLYGDHMTIVFNDGSPEKQAWAESLNNRIGEKVDLKIEMIGVSDNAIAFGVSGFDTQNKHPHVTVAVSPGTKPVASNFITRWGPVCEMSLRGTLLRFDGTRTNN